MSRVCLTKEEEKELLGRAIVLSRRFDTTRPYRLGEFIVDWAPQRNLYVYKDHLQIYSRPMSSSYMQHADSLRELLVLMRRAMLLDDLAGI